MNPKLSKKVLAKIKKGEVSQHSRWYFLIKNWSFWLLFSISLILGSISIALIIEQFTNLEPVLMEYLLEINLSLYLLPLIWLLLLIGFLFLAIVGLKHTPKGYKISPLIILLLSIIASFMLGSVIFLLDWGSKTEELIAEKITIYGNLQQNREKIFLKPEEGLLTGKIKKTTLDQQLLLLIDPTGKEWQVDLSNLQVKNFTMLKAVKITRVHIFGEQSSEFQFIADKILPVPKRKPLERLKNSMRSPAEIREYIIDRRKERLDRVN
jgi:hypothetical protein